MAIEKFGKDKEQWFTERLNLDHGIPSHNTLDDVFAVIDTEQFSECFSNWAADLSNLVEKEIIALDGKCLRSSIDNTSNKAAIYTVSAWSQQNSLVLGQVKVDDKSNEITAIPKLLTRLDIAGAVITIDAMGCPKKIAEQIIQQKGDYVLSLKWNHGLLHEKVTTYFESPLSPEITMQIFEGGHGRIETRTLRVSDKIDWLEKEHSWAGLKSILAVTAKREVGD